jgi:hypothetical protein
MILGDDDFHLQWQQYFYSKKLSRANGNWGPLQIRDTKEDAS